MRELVQKKQVAVISLDPRAGRFYTDQVQELFGNRIEAHCYSVRDGSAAKVERAEVYLVSTDAIEHAEEAALRIPIDAQIVEIHVTYRWETINRLKKLPNGTRAYFVNFTEKMALEAISGLNQLGVNNIVFIPFYPGAPLAENIDMAITPDEERYVPEAVGTVINIGQRVCTSAMMIETALRLGFDDMLESEPFERYYEEVASNNYNFDQMFLRSRRLESRFDILMEILDEGIIGINEKGEVFACNAKACELTGVLGDFVVGRRAGEVFPYLPFKQCLKDKAPCEARVIRIGGTNVNVTVMPVLRQGECCGAFASLQRFNDVEIRQNELRAQLRHKGYAAKYTFDDVLGESPAICRTKKILARMAATESPVLLIGETGTGKELFANAVHNASSRSGKPFVAINCAAMPENLLESELFGYEEGAFTGAKKGGRPGLFEFAHQGTLFLDEVEGMSPALQVKLLRVLQEGEVMRVGGNRIIAVDVRIVAASNEYLDEKVEDGTFRRDLYYRLNTLPALIPPLRERENDIMLLVEYFKKQTGGSFNLSKEVSQIMEAYQWPGNIRELRNVVEYFSYTGSTVITPEDLPPTFSYEPGKREDRVADIKMERSVNRGTRNEKEPWEGRGLRGNDCIFVLEQLYRAAGEGRTIGREGILLNARREMVPLSQQEVRTILRVFDELGLARVSRGRGGSRITLEGRNVWERLRE